MRRALILTAIALTLWSSLAYLGTRLTHLPAFMVTGVALCIGGAIGAFRFRAWRVPRRTFAVGVGGIFGYHFLYFNAFRLAPAVEVNLINYLWPLLIVVLSPIVLPGHRLHPQHIAGAVFGLAGASLIVTGGQLQLDMAHLPGYACAAGAALTWAVYSLLTKRLPPFPTEAVGGFCLVSGVLSLSLYAAAATGGQALVLPAGEDWLVLLLVGLGPMGLDFSAGAPRSSGATRASSAHCRT